MVFVLFFLCSKEYNLFEIEIFCNILNVDKCNVSLLNKSIYAFIKHVTLKTDAAPEMYILEPKNVHIST